MLVAQGGMGEVYRATDSELERTVAVKLLSDRYAYQEDARSRFRREALAAARLSADPNVVTVFDVAEHGGRPLIVMEYLEGGSVYARLQSGAVPRSQALAWLEQAAAALDRAHVHGVVHRDVKPANLLLDRDGNVHVSDFGIASATGADTLTDPGTVLGTAGYLSPEQARGEPATAASDRYALAVVAFELLTGRRPFAGDTPITEAFAHLNAAIPRATAVDPTLPGGVDLVFEDALAKAPDARPASSRELVARLRQALANADDASPTVAIDTVGATTRPTVYESRRRLGGTSVLLAAVVATAGIAVAAIVMRGDEPGRAPARETSSQAGSTIPTESTPTEATLRAEDDGIALNDEGYALIQDGKYAAALPLLRRAVIALRGTGSLTEAYAGFNLAFARFAVGRCDGVVGLIDRSERIQGERREIDELRGEWESRCLADEDADADEDGHPGKGRGKGNGKGKDD